MTLEIKEDIVKFEIAINDAFFMQKIETGPYLSGVKTCPRLGEPSRFLYVEHQVTAVEIFHDEEEMGIGLKSTKKMTEIRMPRCESQNFSLDQSALDVIVLENDVFFQTLDRVHAIGSSQFREQYFAKTSFSQDLKLAESFQIFKEQNTIFFRLNTKLTNFADR